MSIRKFLASAIMAIAATGGLSNVQAATLFGNGSWSEFSVAEPLTGNLNWADFDGNPLRFDFTIAAGQQGVLTIVDTGFIGDTFDILNGAALLGATSAVPVHTVGSEDAIVDFDLALADTHFSRASFALGAGTYSVGGLLTQSAVGFDGVLNSTSGGIRLEVSPVPEPASFALLAAGLGLLAARARRRAC